MPKKKLSKAKQYAKLALVFNKWIRKRDCDGEPGTNCISCQKWYPFEKLHAGHYHHSKSSILRFDPRNVNAQCGFNCNTSRGGNLIEYRINLCKKIGEDQVKEIESIRHQPLKMSPDEIKEEIEHYRELLKELE